MNGDPRAQWDALSDELDALLELDPATRENRLSAIHANDEQRAGALRDWLRAITDSDGLLETRRPAPAGTGPWRPLAPVGDGGMGEIWRGERADGAFTREVAIKFLRGDRHRMAASIGRERALLARLRHPGIAQLLDGGLTCDGRPWLVTEWIDGRRLDDWLAHSSPPPRQRVTLLRRLAEAVAYAHANLVVHRDLKPANVMVAPAGPQVIDFGIARAMADTHRPDDARTIETAARKILNANWKPGKKVRLIGVRVSNLRAPSLQPKLWDWNPQEHEKQERLNAALKSLEQRYGKPSVLPASDMLSRREIVREPTGSPDSM